MKNKSGLFFSFFPFIVVGTLLLAGCSFLQQDERDSQIPSTVDGIAKRLAELKHEINAEVGSARAETSSQCHTLEMGFKACGGPETYLVYSTFQTNELRLRDLVAEYTMLDKEYSMRLVLGSDCALVTPPDVELVDGRCTGKHKIPKLSPFLHEASPRK